LLQKSAVIAARLLPRSLGTVLTIRSLRSGDAGSNGTDTCAGLGLARATAVVRVLMLDERLKGYTLLPLSGGQLIGVDDRLTKGGGGDERERRRIEIRVRRANSTEGSTRTLTPPAITPATPPQNRAASPPATPPQNRAASPPATPPPPRRSSPPDRVVAPSWFPFGTAPTQAAPTR
jgi:hypothetical protein